MSGLFLDEVTLDLTAGNGGRGAVSFRREKFVPNGGPDGGDGGRGADVIIRADAQLTALTDFRDRRIFRAPNGRPGAGSLKAGRDAEHLVLRVPLGTVVNDLQTGERLADLVQHGAVLVAAPGGRGGRGNARFASSTRQAPRIGELGAPGGHRAVRLELKLIADIGLVGLPNAGKSTLLSALTGARPKIAAYPFTTLTPNLGVAELAGGVPIVLADVPGLIEGAHEGTGLGLDFLRHLERTRVLLHVVDAGEGAAAVTEAMRVVAAELEAFSPALAAKPRVLVLNKCDLESGRATAAEMATRLDARAVAAVTGAGCQALLDEAGTMVLAQRADGAAVALLAAPPAVADGSGGGHRVYRHQPRRGRASLAVSRDGDTLVVSSEALEREIAMTDMESEEAVLRLQRRMRMVGVDEVLRGAGVRRGDSVRIGAIEFEWVPDAGDDIDPDAVWASRRGGARGGAAPPRP